MPIRIAEHPRPTHVLLHLSDTHLHGSDPRAGDTLAAMLAEFEASGARADAVVCTGDLAHRGEPRAYRMLRGIVEPVADRLGAAVIWVMGDHDDRAAFREQLLGQPPGMTRPLDRVYEVGDLRVITLDTTVPGAHHGELDGAQLDWLAEELATDAPEGTILAMHHPPLPGAVDLAAAVELCDQDALAEVVEGSDVRAILAGHLHHSASGLFAGIPVSVASGASWTMDLEAPVGESRARDGARSFNLVQVRATTVLHSVVPVGAFPTMRAIDAVESALRLEAAGVRIADPRLPGEAVPRPPGATTTTTSGTDAVDLLRLRLQPPTEPVALP